MCLNISALVFLYRLLHFGLMARAGDPAIDDGVKVDK